MEGQNVGLRAVAVVTKTLQRITISWVIRVHDQKLIERRLAYISKGEIDVNGRVSFPLQTECDLFGYHSVEGDLVVLVMAVTEKPTKLQVGLREFHSVEFAGYKAFLRLTYQFSSS